MTRQWTFTTWRYGRKVDNTRQRREHSTSGCRLWLQRLCSRLCFKSSLISCHESGETNIELGVLLSAKCAQIIKSGFLFFCSDVKLLVDEWQARVTCLFHRQKSLGVCFSADDGGFSRGVLCDFCGGVIDFVLETFGFLAYDLQRNKTVSNTSYSVKNSEFSQQESNLWPFAHRLDALPLSYRRLVGARPYN